eukprot:COSAG06_NODE_2958_length_6025_cov_26.771853_1_plen_130_part_00
MLCVQADIDLHAHPLFTDMKLCTECLNNYNEDENWRLDPERKEENCRICGYNDGFVTNCDETACRHSFCQCCVSIHTEKYGTDEFVGMNSNWGCFVCRKVEDGGFNTNPDYKERIRGGTCSVSYISSLV